MLPESDHRALDDGRKLIIVTGSGRSGTSTVAGALKKLGLAIPQPEVKADSTNPRGFFEPRWVVDFHKRLLQDVGVQTLDARPGALDRAAKLAGRPKVQEELTTWLAEATTGPQVVVKDPRTFWLKDLWLEAATSLGFEAGFVTMLRHPAEVVGSRDAYYTKTMTADQRKARETGHLAGWINVALANEAASRGEPRAFVQYNELISNWRTSLAHVVTALDLEVNVDLSDSAPHPVDDFIDVNLRRVRLTWDDLDVPEHLRELADDVWRCLSELAEANGDEAAISARMDAHREQYNSLYAYSIALVHDATAARVREARRQTRQQVQKEFAAAQQRANVRASRLRRVVRKARALRDRVG